MGPFEFRLLLAVDFDSVKDPTLMAEEPGIPAPRLLVTEAVLVKTPAGQPHPTLAVIVQLTGFAQAVKLPAFQLTELPATVPQELVTFVMQAGTGSVTITLFSGTRLQTVKLS